MSWCVSGNVRQFARIGRQFRTSHDAHEIPALNASLQSRKQPDVGFHESANPVGTVAWNFAPPPGCNGDDGNMTMFPGEYSARPKRQKSLLIGDDGFFEKGMTPESGGGNRNLAGTAV